MSFNTIEYLSSAKFIVDSAKSCFNTCVEDTDRKSLLPIEKHCMEGCMSVKYSIFSTSANNKTPSTGAYIPKEKIHIEWL
jgi:hypothetical protein